MPDDPQRPRTVGDLVGQVRVTTAVAFLGLLALAVGSLGPWVTTVLGSAAGTRGDGKITLAAAAVGMLGLVLGRGHLVGRVVAGVSALVGLGVAGYDLVHIQREVARATLFGHQIAGAGWGVYASLIGAAVALVGLALSERQPVIRVIGSAIAVCGAIGVIIAAGLQSGGPSPATSTTPEATPTTTAPAETTPTATSPTATEPSTTGPAPQSATQAFFRSPTGNIQCEIDSGQAGLPDQAHCQTTSPAASATLAADGSVKTCQGDTCLGNGPEDQFVLAYGTTTKLDPFTCLSSEMSGMRCTLPSGRGFQISKAGIEKL